MGEHEILVELRSYVGRAVEELDKLRKLNAELMRENEEFKLQGGSRSIAESLNLDGLESSAELKEKIQGFMESIDAYLEMPSAE